MARQRLWDETQRQRVKARRIAPINEIVLTDDDGEICRFGVVRRCCMRYDTDINFRGGSGDGVAPIIEIALPRVLWLERPDIS